MEDNIVDSRNRIFDIFRDVHRELNIEFDGRRYALILQKNIILCDFFECNFEFN